MKVYNCTKLFNRPMLLYSLLGYTPNKPIMVRKLATFTLFILLWTVPVILLFGVSTNPIAGFFTFAPPLAMGFLAERPIWGGRPFFEFVIVGIKYLALPRHICDGYGYNDTVSQVKGQTWVSLRRNLLISQKEKKTLG